MVNPISGIPGYNPDATYLPWPTANQPAARPSTPYRQYATQMGPTAPITTGGGESGNNNTTPFDPYGTALGPQIGDWMNTLKSFFGNNKPAITTPATPDPITSAPSSGAAVQPTTLPGGQTVMPVVNPKQPATHVSTGEESLGTLQPGGASPMEPSNSTSDMYYPVQSAPPTDLQGGQYQMPSISPQLHAASSGEESLNNLQPYGPLNSSQPSAGGSYFQAIGDLNGLQLDTGGSSPSYAPIANGQTQFNFNGYSTPNDSTFFGSPHFDASNGVQAGVNVADKFLGPGVDVLAGLAQGFNMVGQAPGTGSKFADQLGTAGTIQSGVANAANWINRQFGGSYMPDSYIAPTLSGPSQPGGPDWNQAVATARGDSAILNGAYGYGKDTYLNDIKAQGAALGITGDNPNLFNPYNVASNNFNNGGGGITGTDGFMGMQLNPGLGGSDLYTGMGANRFFGNNMSGDMGGAGGYGESDIEKYQRMNLGNRWDG